MSYVSKSKNSIQKKINGNDTIIKILILAIIKIHTKEN